MAVTIIIAEAGTGHAARLPSHRLYKAQRLAAAARHAGADFVKLQWFSGKDIFCPMEGDEARKHRWDQSYMDFAEWKALATFCKDIGIGFLASAFDWQAVEYLKLLQPAYYKVASRAAGTYPYASVPGPFLISNAFGKLVGGEVLCDEPKQVFMLCCSPKYPTPLDEARWDHRTHGLSDHSASIWPGVDAILRGAMFLEVHFAVDFADAGPDAPVCLTERELATLCDARDAAAALGVEADDFVVG